MSPLTRFRIQIVAIFTVIGIVIGVTTGFPGWWMFVFLFWSLMAISAILGGAWQDHWDRLKTRDLFRYIERE